MYIIGAMDKQELTKFEQAFAELPPRRREVLLKLLVGKTDEEIAESLGIHAGTVRNQISKLCDDFDLKELGGERRSRRSDLIALVAKYKPELLGATAHILRETVGDYKLDVTLGLRNPFVPLSGMVDDPQLFFDRKKEIGQVFETLNSGSSVAVIGERAIGKSSLLSAICRQAESYLQKPRYPLYLNLQPLETEDDFYSALCDKAEFKETLRGYKLVRALQKKPLLLALDEVENKAVLTVDIRSQLRGLADGSDAPIRLVLATSTSLDVLFNDEGITSPLENLCISQNLEPWDNKTAHAFISSRLNYTPVTFTEDEIAKIVQESGGYPQKLMQQCHETYARYLKESV